MKAITVLATTCAATGLFSGTIVGGLAMQGRLDFAGTQGIPILHSFFEEPPPEEGEGSAEGEGAHGTGTSPGAEGAEGAGDERLDGMGREEQMGHALGPSVRDEGAPAGAPVGRPLPDTGQKSGAHGDDQGTGGHGETAAPGTKGHGPQTGTSDWKHRTESVMGQDQYRRGKLFKFPRLESGMSVEELNRVLGSVNGLDEALKRRRAALDEREAEMNAREADIEERGKGVQEMMRQVLQARQKLEEEVTAFERTYTLVQKGKAKEYRTYAETIAKLEPDKASQLIRRMWGTEEGKTKVTKILAMMEAEARQEIFTQLNVEETQEILARLATAVVEQDKK